LFGCKNEQSSENQNFDIYNTIREQLIAQKEYDEIYDFRATVVFNQLENGYRYDVIIDEPVSEMYQITAMSYADETADNMCPNIGIFDEDSYNLKKDYIDKSSGFYKGIQLSGTTLEKQTVRVYVSYYTDANKKQKIEKYIEVKEE